MKKESGGRKRQNSERGKEGERGIDEKRPETGVEEDSGPRVGVGGKGIPRPTPLTPVELVRPEILVCGWGKSTYSMVSVGRRLDWVGCRDCRRSPELPSGTNRGSRSRDTCWCSTTRTETVLDTDGRGAAWTG